MKTVFRNLAVMTMLGASLATTRYADAGNIINQHVLAEDTFKLNTQFTTQVYDSFGVPSPVNQTRVALVEPVTVSPLSGSLPELRELDEIHDWVGAPAAQHWLTSTQNLAVVQKLENNNDGMVQRIDPGASSRDVAYIPTFRQAGGAGYPDADWIVSAQVQPGLGEFVGLGWTEEGAPTSTYGFHQGYGEVWAMLQTIQGTASPATNDLPYLFGRLCLWVNDVDAEGNPTQTMVSRSENVLNLADLSTGAVVGDFDYDPNGFNELIVTYDGPSNSAAIELNGQMVIVAPLNSFDFDAELLGIQKPDFYGAGFELRGGAKLDDFAATPEPSSMLMMCFGMLFFGMQNRRQRRRAQKLGLTSSIAG